MPSYKYQSNLINWSSPAKPDDVFFNEKEFINGSTLPIVPGKMFIGKLDITSKDPNPSNRTTINKTPIPAENENNTMSSVECFPSSVNLEKTGIPLVLLLVVLSVAVLAFRKK